MKRYLYNLLLIIVMASFNGVHADQPEPDPDKQENEKKEEIKYEAIIISARGYGAYLSRTPGGTGIISSDELGYGGASSLTNALETVPGVSRTGDSAWGSELTIRGASRENLVFLVDGSRMVTATDINARFGTIDPAAIERVEILKGPISSLYGSGTMGGVVNVISRNGRFSEVPDIDLGLNISCNTNSQGYNTYAYTGYNTPSFYAFASGSHRSHGSYSDGAGDEMENSGFNDAQGVLNLGFRMNDSHRIETKTQYYKGWDIGVPGAADAGLPATADVTCKSVSRALAGMDYVFTPSGRVLEESRLHLAWQYIERCVLVDSLPAATSMKKLEPESQSSTYTATWTSRLRAGDHTIVTGLDSWLRTLGGQRVKTKLDGTWYRDTPLPDSWYLSGGLFAEDDWKIFRDFTLNVGGRIDGIKVNNRETMLYEETTFSPAPSNYVLWDEHDVSEYSWNAHAGLTYDISGIWATSILAARGYRAASLEERYKYISLSGGVEKWGNPDLKPEESLFFEYGLHRYGSVLTINLAGIL